MAEIRKITTGFVTQRWDSETGKFLGQDFTASDEVAYEDESGNAIDQTEPEYRCFEMVQEPPVGPTLELTEQQSEAALLG